MQYLTGCEHLCWLLAGAGAMPLWVEVQPLEQSRSFPPSRRIGISQLVEAAWAHETFMKDLVRRVYAKMKRDERMAARQEVGGVGVS